MEKREFHPFYGWAWSVQYFGLVIPKTPLYSMMTLISFWFRSTNLLLYVQRCVVLYVALSHCFLLSILCVSLNDSVNRVEIVNANYVIMHSLDWNRCESLMILLFLSFPPKWSRIFQLRKGFQPVSSGFSSSVLFEAAEMCITVEFQDSYLVVAIQSPLFTIVMTRVASCFITLKWHEWDDR